jgi:CheY-like chemotaxis protein
MNHSPIRILLADDDEDDRLIFVVALKQIKQAVNVTTVNNGVELMDYLKEHEAKELPHILFLDLNMPLKGGLDCLKEIRSTRELKDLSVAIYSTSASEEDIENTFIQGANVYIKKPNDFTRLVSVLSEVITVNWQYTTSDLNKENFVLSI